MWSACVAHSAPLPAPRVFHSVRCVMADRKSPAFAPNSVAHRAAQVVGEYLPRELARITGEYLRVLHEWDAETGWKSPQRLSR
jgi:hypothetical protein